MTRSAFSPLVLAALTLVVSAAATLDARAPTARDRYQAAQTREAEAREAVEQVAPAAPAGDVDRVVRPARRVIIAYEGVVRRFPTSGYSDNALLQAATLSQFLYGRFGRAADRVAAEKYYDWLVREYPSSPLRRQARAAVRALDTIVPAAGKAASATRAATAAPPRPAMPGGAGNVERPPTPAASVAAAAGPGAPSASGATRPTVATLRAIERTVLDSAVRITLALDREAPFSHEVLGSPPRAFVDLFGATVAESLQDAAMTYEAGAVRQVRVGRRSGAVRVVLDLDGAAPTSVFALYNPYRVVIDAEHPSSGRRAVAGTAPAANVASVAGPAATPPAMAAVAPAAPVVPVVVDAGPDVRLVDEREADLSPRPPPPDVDEFSAEPVAAAMPPPAPMPAVAPPTAPPSTRSVAVDPAALPPVPAQPRTPVLPAAPAPNEPAANTDGTFSLARQLGLGVSRIVIDAGHGGHDPGTLTSGTSEARLVLDVALRLEKLLVKDGFDVVLTRRTDVFIPLEQRTAMANREGADLFLSIHANASRDPKARGIEVYYLSFASNPEAEAVAARENATSAGGMHNLPSIVRAIALNNKLDESRDLAAMVQQSLTTRLSKTHAGVRNRGVKKAPFVVLIGAQMPSILAEIGFVTNRQEAALIKTPAYRQKIAESLQAAVLQYRRSLKRQSAVASR